MLRRVSLFALLPVLLAVGLAGAQEYPLMERTAFINRVAAPIANKLFECGMIP
jgi:hypothetical protein